MELNSQRAGEDDLILVENEIDVEPPPLNFNYISSSIYNNEVSDPDGLELSCSHSGYKCYICGHKSSPNPSIAVLKMLVQRLPILLLGKYVYLLGIRYTSATQSVDVIQIALTRLCNMVKKYHSAFIVLM